MAEDKMETITVENSVVNEEQLLNSEIHDHSYATSRVENDVENVDEQCSPEIHDHSYAASPESNLNLTCEPIELDLHEVEIPQEILIVSEPIDSSKNVDSTVEKTTSLGIIASVYDNSDSEEENDNVNNSVNIETEISTTVISEEFVNNNEYRRNIEVTCISDSSSDDDSSSSDSESDSDDSSVVNLSDSDSDDEGNSKKTNNTRVTKQQKGEFDDLPRIEDLQISVPEVLCDPLGQVAWTVEQMVVVRPNAGKPTLNLDTILFVDKGKRALGRIFDVFGQVADPHYCIRFNDSEHIKDCDIKVGMTVYYCPNTEYTSLVFLSEMTKMKACDTVGDDEPPEFSDDEEEQKYYAELRNKQNKERQESESEVPKKRKRNNSNKSGWKSNHPWNSSRDVQNYTRRNYAYANDAYYQSAMYAQSAWYRPNYSYPNQWQQSYDSMRGNHSQFGVPPMTPWNGYPQPGSSYQQAPVHPMFQAPPPPPPPGV